MYFPKNRKQAYIRKSGGIGVFVKNDIAKHVSIVNTESEYILWVKIDRNYTKLEDDLLIGIIYIPPSQSRFYSEDEFSNLNDEITSMCSKYDYVFITGDANARTSELIDYTHSDKFLSEYFNFDEDTLLFYDSINTIQLDNFCIERKSKDSKTNNIGYKLIDICKNNNLYILNGRIGNDKHIGNLTFRNQSLIDYTLASTQAISLIKQFDITDTDALMSDGHSILNMYLSIRTVVETPTAINGDNNIKYKPKWNHEQSHQFIDNINDDEFNEMKMKLEFCHQHPTKDSVNEVAKTIAEIFTNSAKVTFVECSKSNTPNKTSDKPWFGPKCRNSRILYHAAKKTVPPNENKY